MLQRFHDAFGGDISHQGVLREGASTQSAQCRIKTAAARIIRGQNLLRRSVSLDHAAQLLGVSRRTIYNRIREGRLQTIRTLGGSQRVLLDSVQVVRSQAADRTTSRSTY